MPPVRIRPMAARDVHEEHRVATPLELFFDLCFVVAVAQAASTLHHALAEDHLKVAIIGYPTAFFAIWWAWMNFTWFSSAYDNDDLIYRLGVLVQIVGVLILAAGVPRALLLDDFAVVTLGYLMIWLLHAPVRRSGDVAHRLALPVAAVAVLLAGALGAPVLVMGLIVAAPVVLLVISPPPPLAALPD